MQPLIAFFDSKGFGTVILIVVGLIISFSLGLDGWRALLLPLGSAISYWVIFNDPRASA